jgi:hypothetical protein
MGIVRRERVREELRPAAAGEGGRYDPRNLFRVNRNVPPAR